MRVLLGIEDSKALHLMEVLKGLSYVKTKTISNEKAVLMEEIKEAVDKPLSSQTRKIKIKDRQGIIQ